MAWSYQRRRLLLPLVLAAPLACSEVAVTAVDVARVEIEPATPTLVTGQSMSLRATLRDGLGNALNGRTVSWASSDPAVVDVNGDGLVTGLTVGTARVTAAVDGQEGESTVTVLAKPVAAVAIEPAAVQLILSQSVALSALPKAADGETLADRGIAWQSENPAVAAVDASGVVTATGTGSTRVLATSEGVTGAAAVTVSPKPVAAVQLAPAQILLQENDTARFSVVLQAADGSALTGRTITWRSEDATIAQVDATGLITAVGAGSTRVIAASEGVEGAGALQVTLRPVSAVTITPAAATLSIGAATQLQATLTAADGTVLAGRPVQWSSDAPGVALVDPNGRVTAIGAGTATITATAEGVSGRATIDVQVTPVATVTVLPATLDLKPGDTGALVAETRAADGTLLTGRAVSWSSSNTAVATVDGSGTVTGVTDGSATITATSEGQAGTATVNVKTALQPVAKVTVSPASASLKTGDLQQFTATMTAADGSPLTGRPVTWSSSDVSVLLIDAQGGAAALAPGSATVTATSEGVNGTASVSVTTPPPPPVPVATVTVTPTGVRLVPGATQQFTATARAADGTVLTGRTVAWTTGSSALITVNGQGLATAVSPGTSHVKATIDGVSGQVTVTVDPPPAATVRVIPAFSLLQRGKDLQLRAEVRAADGTLLQKAVTWSSSNSAIANVTSGGLVKAKRTGTVTITAAVDGKSGSAIVVILP